jgi:hypothetical protein
VCINVCVHACMRACVVNIAIGVGVCYYNAVGITRGISTDPIYKWGLDKYIRKWLAGSIMERDD